MSNRNKQAKRGTTNPLNMENINWFNVLTMILGTVALFFSWRANVIANKSAEIAAQEFKSNVVVLDIKNLGYSLDSTHQDSMTLACMERMRFANLGNAKDSIIGFDTVVYYQKTKSIFKGHGEAWSGFDLSSSSTSDDSYTISDALKSVLKSLEIKVAPDLAFQYLSPIDNGSLPSGVKSVSFPYDTEGFSSFDLEMSVVYGIPRSKNFNFILEKGQAVFPENPTDLPPIEFEIVFRFASGLETSTPQFECGFVGE